MFFGLTSPCTSARLFASVTATSRSSRSARSGCARPVAMRYGSSRMSRKIASVGKASASEGSAAVAAMNACGGRRHRRGETGLGDAVAQQRLPQRIALRRKVGHRQHAGVLILTQQCRHGARCGQTSDLHPACFIDVALDRRAPVGIHAQLGQGALDADWAAAEVDPPNVGRHATCQPLPLRFLFGLGGAQQSHAPKRLENFPGWGHSHGGQASSSFLPTPRRVRTQHSLV